MREDPITDKLQLLNRQRLSKQGQIYPKPRSQKCDGEAGGGVDPPLAAQTFGAGEDGLEISRTHHALCWASLPFPCPVERRRPPLLVVLIR